MSEPARGSEQDRAAFQEAMRGIYDRASAECGYRPTYFLQMIQDRGGLGAADALLAAPSVSEGFTKLALLGRLDLTVEALVLEPRWSGLFDEDQLKRARRRLGR